MRRSGSWSLYSTEWKNERFPWNLSMKGCPVCPSFFPALKQTGQLSLSAAEPPKGPSLCPLQCHTSAWVPSPQMHICTPLHDQTPPYSCLTDKSQQPTQLTLLPCCHRKRRQKESRSKHQQAGLFLISMFILLKADLSYNPPAEGGGNTQRYPVITDPW